MELIRGLIQELLPLFDLSGAPEEVVRAFTIVVAVAAVLLVIVIFDRVENVRFKRWYNSYGVLELEGMLWRTIVPWHKTGSKWYLRRIETPSPVLNGKEDRIRNPQGKMSGNSFAIHAAKRGGGGSFGDGSGNSINR